MTCRDEIVTAAKELCLRLGRDTLTLGEILAEVQVGRTSYAESRSVLALRVGCVAMRRITTRQRSMTSNHLAVGRTGDSTRPADVLLAGHLTS